MAHLPPRPLPSGLRHRPTSVPLPGRPISERRAPAPVRRFEILYENARGDIDEMAQMAPAIPPFEAAFSAFAHGTLILGADGPIAIEDLLPGMPIQTRDHGLQNLIWIGAITLVPRTSDPRVPPARLTRITADSIGLGRPNRDLVLGPHARILRRNPVCMSLFGTEAAFAPADAFVDGLSIIDVAPVSPVRVFHLGLAGQHVLFANGIEVESYHPGRLDTSGIAPALLPTFLNLFPHAEALSDFGQMRIPRLSREDVLALESS